MNKKLNTTFKQYMFFEDKSMMTMHSVQQYLDHWGVTIF